ncbi:hypothetical protein NVP1009O_24 [Vibrio phage 1.009.O._10N.261.51.C9]|nr:hypothetical protein NVP1009O_24 [Vibrio phage 1.009.O._10N.261.51.C9]
MTITTNLTQAKATAEARRLAKLEEDLKAFGGEHTTLTVTARQTERQAIIASSAAMQVGIQAAADEASLQALVDTMNS